MLENNHFHKDSSYFRSHFDLSSELIKRYPLADDFKIVAMKTDSDYRAQRLLRQNAFVGITDTGWISSELKAKWGEESPMGRGGVPGDAARLIRFLASEDAGWITGQVIHSRGGL